MITVINASDFCRIELAPHLFCYQEPSLRAPGIDSIVGGLNANYWRQQYHPFAHVLVDVNAQEFLLVRDHLGVRPLYYWWQGSLLVFGNTVADVVRDVALHTQRPLLKLDGLFVDNPYYSDHTLHQGVNRVEPGHYMHCQANGRLTKNVFWQLEKEGAELHYRDKNEYLEHFAALMQESITLATAGHTAIAAEFSAGLDSSAIYCGSAALGLNPTLFMHVSDPSDPLNLPYNSAYEQAFLKHYPAASLQRIAADSFDAIPLFNAYTRLFAGPAPHLFELFAHNIHQAVSQQGYTLLLSGFGGDQGVSGHVPLRFVLPSLLQNKQIKLAWQLCQQEKTKSSAACFVALLQASHPQLHGILRWTRQLIRAVQNMRVAIEDKRFLSTHPYHVHYFKTLREAEWSFLQGPLSQEVRMRIEYSSVVAKQMGFEYRYPLLYPKLLEFFLSIPVTQKRQQGIGRFLMKRYLSMHLPSLFDVYHKKEGLSICPATLAKFKRQHEQGLFANDFAQLPLAKQIADPLPLKTMIKTIQAYMLKIHLNDVANSGAIN